MRPGQSQELSYPPGVPPMRVGIATAKSHNGYRYAPDGTRLEQAPAPATVLSSAASTMAIAGASEQPSKAGHDPGGRIGGSLPTPKQLQVLQLLAEGLTQKEVALKLGNASRNAIRNCVVKMLARLNVANTAQAIHVGHREGWLR